ncbi:30S ribosomal protein S13 [Patescibacteria group bacterium]
MVRISGVNMPDKKKIGTALTTIYGVGAASARKILDTANVSPNKFTKELKNEEILRIKNVVEKQPIEGTLRREILMNIKHLKDVGAYRGLRHMKGLPVRGQRTKTNSRTRRGNVRRTMSSGKRALEKK